MDTAHDSAVVIVKDLLQKAGKDILLDNVSFDVKQGEMLGIFGLRASGKTTLLHIVAGVDRFTSGFVEVFGHDIKKDDKYKKYVGLVTQKRSLFLDLKAGENLDFIATLKNADKTSIGGIIQALELEQYLQYPVSKLEIGVYQRLSLACAMLGKPRLLLLDNLIKDLDLYSRQIILREIKKYQEQGGTCICGFSNIEFSNYMSRVAWLEDGQLTIYAPHDAVDKWQELVDYYSDKREEDA